MCSITFSINFSIPCEPLVIYSDHASLLSTPASVNIEVTSMILNYHVSFSLVLHYSVSQGKGVSKLWYIWDMGITLYDSITWKIEIITCIISYQKIIIISWKTIGCQGLQGYGTSIRLGLETIYQTTAEVYFLRYQNYMKYILLRTSCQKVWKDWLHDSLIYNVRVFAYIRYWKI